MSRESDPRAEVKFNDVPEEFLESIAQPGDQESGFETLSYTPADMRDAPTIIDADEFGTDLNDPITTKQNGQIRDWMERGSPLDENPFIVD